jgi:hypothetical protein
MSICIGLVLVRPPPRSTPSNLVRRPPLGGIDSREPEGSSLVAFSRPAFLWIAPSVARGSPSADAHVLNVPPAFAASPEGRAPHAFEG